MVNFDIPSASGIALIAVVIWSMLENEMRMCGKGIVVSILDQV